MSKGILVAGLAITVLKDAFTKASNNEIALYVISISAVSIALKYVVEAKK